MRTQRMRQTVNIEKDQIINITARHAIFVILAERQRMIKIVAFFVVSLLLLVITHAGTINVRYLSLENVYVNGGKADGIAVGTILIVKRQNSIVARMEVIYTAEHSASCKILEKNNEIMIGDEVYIFQQKAAIDTSAVKESEKPLKKTELKKTKSDYPSRINPDVTGYLALQWFHFQDGSESNYHFDQPAIRFKLKARNIWHRYINLEIKMRSRYSERYNRHNAIVPETE